MPWAPFAIMGVMTVLQTVSSVQQAKQGEDAAKKRGEIALAAGQARAAQIARQGERFASTQLAAAGASGAVPVSGSSLELQLETARETRMQELDAIYASQLENWGAQGEAAGFRTESNNALLKGIGSLASSAAGAYGGSISGASMPAGFMGGSLQRTQAYQGYRQGERALYR